jgi:hypothetical protein
VRDLARAEIARASSEPAMDQAEAHRAVARYVA